MTIATIVRGFTKIRDLSETPNTVTDKGLRKYRAWHALCLVRRVSDGKAQDLPPHHKESEKMTTMTKSQTEQGTEKESVQISSNVTDSFSVTQ